jgi:hypothetical protein
MSNFYYRVALILRKSSHWQEKRDILKNFNYKKKINIIEVSRKGRGEFLAAGCRMEGGC